jgi:hypothetical protein
MNTITLPSQKVICPLGNITGSQKLFETIFFSGNEKAKLYMGKKSFILFFRSVNVNKFNIFSSKKEFVYLPKCSMKSTKSKMI